MTAEEITGLLASKHCGDIFVPQCKDGDTWFHKVKIMDAWTIQKSWTKPYSTCYEIKISRSDFMNDKKWIDYLPYCNSFYFVAPAGIIDKSEVPEQAGLMLVSSTGTRLFTKKKAPFRNVKVSTDILMYILMWRSQITKEHVYQTDREKIEEWLENKEKNKEFGEFVSKKLREEYNKQITTVRQENERLQRENERLKKVREFCKKYKVNYDSYFMSEDNFKEGILRAVCGVDIEKIIGRFQDAESELRKIRNDVMQGIKKHEE